MASRLLDRSHAVGGAGPASPVAHLRLEDRHVATEPPEARGTERSAVRLLVSIATGQHVDTRVDRIGDHLRPGDVLAVNTSGTRNAAIDVVGATVGPLASSRWATRSLVDVLPDEPVMPVTVSPRVATRVSTTCRATAASPARTPAPAPSVSAAST